MYWRAVDIVLAFQRHQFGGRHVKTPLRHPFDANIDERSLLEDLFPDHEEAGKAFPLVKVEKIELRLKQQAVNTDLEVTGAQMHVITDRELLLRCYTRLWYPGCPDGCLSSDFSA